MKNSPQPRRRPTPTAAASLFAVILLVGCGPFGGDEKKDWPDPENPSKQVASGAVARVDGNDIGLTDFNTWVRVAQRQADSKSRPRTLLPPDFDECVASLLQSGELSSRAQAKSNCQSSFDQQKQQVMQLLITTEWIKGQASLMGIKVTDAEVRKKFDETKNQAFPNKGAYEKFLKTTGQTEESLLERIRIEVASQKIREAVIAKAEKNKGQSGTPETRSYHMIFARDKAEAEAARNELEGGASWKDVARKYSRDAQTKNSGGEVKDAVKGQQDPALDKVVFSSDKGKISEPIKGSLGWYVVEVDSSKPGSTTPSAEVKSRWQQEALQAFVKAFQEKWKAATVCARYYGIDICGNGPKKSGGAGTESGKQEAPSLPGVGSK